MKLVQVEITGTAPLLMHRFGEEAEVEGAKPTRRVQLHERPPREQAERAAYRDSDGALYIPGAAVARLLREAGGSHKQKGSRKSVKYLVPSAVLVSADTLPLLNGVGPLTDYEVDSRPVTIPSTKGRVMRHRPRLDAWRLEVDLEIDEDILPAEMVHQLLVEGGRGIGLGDFRPERGGPFGRFRVTRWDEREADPES
ncbi:MAG: hypothetical protein H0W36_07775 [Gemmatimonadetes bacterium]|nr:hypothetical protein [Gemmatimonadota bacterium]